MDYLGYSYKDSISGFAGVATGVATYLTGCKQVLLAPPVTSEGAWREAQWFDAQRLVRTSVTRIELDNGPNPGFDKAAPKR